jgi:methyl-accepting chemotaxis protein
VDKATREVLEQLSDQLDIEPGWAAGLRTELSGRIASESEASREQGQQVAERLCELVGQVSGFANSVLQGLADVVRRLEEGGNVIDRHAKTATAGIQALSAHVEAVRAELRDVADRTEAVERCLTSVGSGTAEGFGDVHETLANLTATIGRQQSQIEELLTVIQRLSRPWWKKVLGRSTHVAGK